MIKPETKFRMGYVNPFLKTLKNTFEMSIQQIAIHGHPDKVLCSRGKFIALELKTRGGRLRPLQEHLLNEVRRCGGIALIADPDNWQEIKEILKQLDKGEYRAKAT